MLARDGSGAHDTMIICVIACKHISHHPWSIRHCTKVQYLSLKKRTNLAAARESILPRMSSYADTLEARAGCLGRPGGIDPTDTYSATIGM
jgi:hypothetical protein